MKTNVQLRLLVTRQDSDGELLYQCQPKTLRLPLRREERELALQRLVQPQDRQPQARH